MLVKQRRPSTNPYLRSLLQKAVRRGHGDLAANVAARLDQIGDARWLRSRAVVLAYEECWPSAIDMALAPNVSSKVSWVRRLAGLKKNKDAAGLGTLAYALSEGDPSVLEGSPDERAIRLIAAAIKRPTDFWQWATNEKAATQQARVFARQAQANSSAPTWPWDKAFVMAAAYLAIGSAVVPSTSAGPMLREDFPFWCAVDKHTPAGKAALTQVAENLKVSRRQLTWASFYFESAVVNDLGICPWWDAERRWRLQRAGLTASQAEDLWNSARELFIAQTAEATAGLIRDAQVESRPALLA